MEKRNMLLLYDKNIISRIRTRLICFFDRIAFLSDFYGMTVK
jgi:hypothetical protein